ncbi:hypothetical protein [Microbacterium sp. NPDC055455]
MTLPAEGFTGVVPAFPLVDALEAEVELWASLWEKPQAFMWSQLGLEMQVATYVRNFLKATAHDAAVGWMTPVLRQEAELGLSTVGMGQLRWKIASDELAERREDAPQRSSSMKNRLKAVNGGD